MSASASLALSIVTGVLQTIGVVLLWILLILLVLVLLVLLVPVRYRAEGAVRDPEAHETLDDETLALWGKNAGGRFAFSWLFHAVRGGINWPDNPVFTVKILAWTIDIGAIAEKQKAKRKAAKEQAEREGTDGEQKDGRAGKSAKEKWAAFREKLPEYRIFLNQESTKRAIRAILDEAGRAAAKVLPGDWSVTGTAGFGDPEIAGYMLQAEGILVPLTGEHVWILPEYQKVQCDVEGHAAGKIRIAVLAAAALKLLLNKDVRKAVRFVKAERR